MKKLFLPALALVVGSSIVFAAAGGFVWQPLPNVPAQRDPYVDDLYVAGKYGVALVHHRYLWLSEDHGLTWTREIDLRDSAGLNLPSSKIPTAVALRGPRIYVGGRGFLASSPDGNTWTYFDSNFPNAATWYITAIAAPKVASSNAYAVGWFRRPTDGASVRRPLVVRTTDNGQTWERWGTPPVEPGAGDETSLLAVAVARDGVVVVTGTNAVVAQRRESGGPWQDLNPPAGWGSLSGSDRIVYALAVGGGTANHIIWAGRRDGKVMIKRGNNPWTVRTVAPGLYIRDIAFRTSNEGVAYGFVDMLSHFKIYHTSDGGQTWYEEILPTEVKATGFNVEATAASEAQFIADVVVPRGPTHTTRAWLALRKFYFRIPDKFREPLMRRPIPIPGPGPVERIPGRLGQPQMRAPQVR